MRLSKAKRQALAYKTSQFALSVFRFVLIVGSHIILFPKADQDFFILHSSA